MPAEDSCMNYLLLSYSAAEKNEFIFLFSPWAQLDLNQLL